VAALLQLERIVTYYGPIRILKSINLNVDQGEDNQIWRRGYYKSSSGQANQIRYVAGAGGTAAISFDVGL